METKTMTVVNDAGDAFTVKVIRKGERYGRSGKQIADRAMVEFYDCEFAGRPGFDALGQFVASYYVHSLTGTEWGNNPAQLRRSGLTLDCGTAKWNVSGANMTAIFDWL